MYTTVLVIIFRCQNILFIYMIQFRYRCDICKKLQVHILSDAEFLEIDFFIFLLAVDVNWLCIIL